MLASKAPEAWIAILGGAAYVWHKSGKITRKERAIEAGIAAIISIALGEDVVVVTGYPPALVHFVIAVFSFAILDFTSSMFADKEELSAAIRAFFYKWLGIEVKKSLPPKPTEKSEESETPKPRSKRKSESEDK